jgi:asparagine N-glycosylation enzyme membrane subunit Stt3
MNDQSPMKDSQPEPLSRREARQQRREVRNASAGGLTWVAGILLIVLGIAFLMDNLGSFPIPLDNWWALFVLIPALGAFDKAWQIYRQADNQLTATARGSLLAGFILTLVTAVLLFDLNWSIFGPILIILVGIGIVLNFTLPGKE